MRRIPEGIISMARLSQIGYPEHKHNMGCEQEGKVRVACKVCISMCANIYVCINISRGLSSAHRASLLAAGDTPGSSPHPLAQLGQLEREQKPLSAPDEKTHM